MLTVVSGLDCFQSHLLVDAFKPRFPDRRLLPVIGLRDTIDQGFHFLQILVVWLL